MAFQTPADFFIFFICPCLGLAGITKSARLLFLASAMAFCLILTSVAANLQSVWEGDGATSASASASLGVLFAQLLILVSVV